MNAKATHKKIGALAATLLAGAAFLVAPVANAASVSAGTVVAADQAGTVIAQDQSAQITATPSAPRAVTVTTEPGALVTLKSTNTKSKKAAKPQTKIANKDGQVTFTKLNAGTNYTVIANGRSTTVTPVVKVGQASDLTVMTTDQVGTVDLTWQHKATKARGEVGYAVTATPANSALDPITAEASTTQAELTGLDPNALYSFSVTPHNPLGNGKPSVARMSRSLAAITGISGPANSNPVAQDPNKDANTNATPAPQPAPKPGPAPAPKPGTKTIYVCPDGWGDVNGVCTQTKDYTFHTEKQTQDYTYTSDRRLEPCTGGDCPGSEYKDFGTDWSGTTCPNGGTMHDGKCLGWTTGQKWVTYQVKDAPPMGWYDDGSQYAKDVQVKDATPAGWSDNGSQWIRTTAKVEKVVPA